MELYPVSIALSKELSQSSRDITIFLEIFGAFLYSGVGEQTVLIPKNPASIILSADLELLKTVFSNGAKLTKAFDTARW